MKNKGLVNLNTLWEVELKLQALMTVVATLVNDRLLLSSIQQYSVVKDDVTQRAIWLSVWDQDRFGSNKFLGELCLPLSSLDLSDSTPFWYKLQDFAEAGGILHSAPVPSASSPTSPTSPTSPKPVGGMPTPFQAVQSEPRRKLLEEEPTEAAKPAE